jgi:hypothetical protein
MDPWDRQDFLKTLKDRILCEELSPGVGRLIRKGIPALPDGARSDESRAAGCGGLG